MRLLHTQAQTMKDFIVDEEIPPYAILSHTWGDDEVSYQDWQGLPKAALSPRKGYQKIKSCCEEAARDGLEWVWIDTCCIDKTSSAELSEAINSMFRWYKNSQICYAYLSDVQKRDTLAHIYADVNRSRWFTRGWTLQELIAPATLQFFSADWQFIGDKVNLSRVIRDTTGIEPKYLDSRNLDLASVAKKMSWAARRKTSRTEDAAYSLLGLFDVNMPLIHGEGKKAFKRLQDEIIKSRSEDHSIYAWGTVVSKPSTIIDDEGQLWGETVIPWKEHRPLLGLLAESPSDFALSGQFVPSRGAGRFYRDPSRNVAMPVPVDSGVRLELPVVGSFDSVYHWDKPRISQIRPATMAVLFCCHEDNPMRLVQIPLQRWGYLYNGRTQDLLLDDSVTISQESMLFKSARPIHVAPERRRPFGRGDIIVQRHKLAEHFQPSTVIADPQIGEFDSGGVLEVHGKIHGRLIAISHRLTGVGDRHGFALCLGRVNRPGARWGNFCVEVMPVLLGDTSGPEDRDYYGGLSWTPFRYVLKEGALYAHVMSAPTDTWTVDVAPFPRVRVRVQREFFDQDDIFIDIVEIDIMDNRGNQRSRGQGAYGYASLNGSDGRGARKQLQYPYGQG